MNGEDRKKICNFLIGVGFHSYGLIRDMKCKYKDQFPTYNMEGTKDYMNYCNNFYKELMQYHTENDDFNELFDYIEHFVPDEYLDIIPIIKNEIEKFI